MKGLERDILRSKTDGIKKQEEQEQEPESSEELLFRRTKTGKNNLIKILFWNV